jgi:hypothetical protein
MNDNVNKSSDKYTITSITVVKGEGSLIMVRGKRKIGYEMDLDVSLRPSDSTNDIKFKMIELCDDDDDCHSIDFISAKSTNAENVVS